jgi:proteasome lid subunit RPN8/RPN11
MSRDVIVHSDAIQSIEEHMRADTSQARWGLLVGMASQSGEIVIITSVVLGGPTETLEELRDRAASEHAGQRVVGWFRSHPDGGVALTQDELEVQRASFSRPWHVLYVYDPIRDQRGFFGWSGDEFVRLPSWNVTAAMTGDDLDQPVMMPVIEEPAAEPTEVEPNAVEDAAPDEEIEPVEEPGVEPPLAEPVSTPPERVDYLDAASRSSKTPWIVIGAAALVAVIVGVILINANDDDNLPSVTTESTGASESSSESSSSSTSEATTSTPGTTGGTIGSQPPTPTSVATPAARVGAGAVPCEPSSDNTYEPLSDCFVPLGNGNIVIFKSGSLLCADPSGTVVAGEAQSFTIGTDADPLAITADGAAVQKCADLIYAKNVMAGGNPTLDGLCGSSGTQINEATTRCFSANPTSGAIVAIMRSTTNATQLTGSCFSGATEPIIAELSWSDAAVDASWRIDSVAFDPAAGQFVATASKAGATATANLACG